MSGNKSKLSRKEAAAHLATLGYPLSPRTLESLAARRRGPPYVRFGWCRVSYDVNELEEWARGQRVGFRGEKKRA